MTNTHVAVTQTAQRARHWIDVGRHAEAVTAAVRRVQSGDLSSPTQIHFTRILLPSDQRPDRR
jgi:hypothetical protein